jgi:hypothetical protein
MGFRYREHLIFPVAYLDPVIGDWTASVHIEFTEKLKIHTVVLRSDDVFQTEVQAKRFITKEAKEWVNDRLRTAREPRVKTTRKHVSSASSRSKQAIYWICRPCKNNRHDLCLKESISRAGTNVKIQCWCSLQPTHETRLREGSEPNVKPSAKRTDLSRK